MRVHEQIITVRMLSLSGRVWKSRISVSSATVICTLSRFSLPLMRVSCPSSVNTKSRKYSPGHNVI